MAKKKYTGKYCAMSKWATIVDVPDFVADCHTFTGYSKSEVFEKEGKLYVKNKASGYHLMEVGENIEVDHHFFPCDAEGIVRENGKTFKVRL